MLNSLIPKGPAVLGRWNIVVGAPSGTKTKGTAAALAGSTSRKAKAGGASGVRRQASVCAEWRPGEDGVARRGEAL